MTLAKARELSDAIKGPALIDATAKLNAAIEETASGGGYNLLFRHESTAAIDILSRRLSELNFNVKLAGPNSMSVFWG